MCAPSLSGLSAVPASSERLIVTECACSNVSTTFSKSRRQYRTKTFIVTYRTWMGQLCARASQQRTEICAHPLKVAFTVIINSVVPNPSKPRRASLIPVLVVCFIYSFHIFQIKRFAIRLAGCWHLYNKKHSYWMPHWNWKWIDWFQKSTCKISYMHAKRVVFQYEHLHNKWLWYWFVLRGWALKVLSLKTPAVSLGSRVSERERFDALIIVFLGSTLKVNKRDFGPRL